MKTLFNIGNSIFFFFTLMWSFFTIYFSFQYLNVDFTNINELIAIFLTTTSISIILLFHFRKKIIPLIKSMVQFLINHKLLVLILLLIYQLIILLTSVGLASADTTIVYHIATDKQFALTTNYISLNPNNYLLVLWFKYNNFFFKENLIVSLAVWNILFIDLSIYLLYLINKLLFSKQQANIVFLLSTVILGFSPQFIYTYSDPITLFLLILTIFLIVKSVGKTVSPFYQIAIGLALSIAYGFRPTVLIFIIAGFIVLVFKCVENASISFLIKSVKKTIMATAIFLLTTSLISFHLSSQDDINYNENESRTALYYINLGLTYSGNVHSEISPKVLSSAGDNRNKVALEEIKERLNNYKYNTFVGHLFYKYYWMTAEGNFGWFQERVLSENSLLNIGWLKRIQAGRTARFIRNFIYVEGKYYTFFASFIQINWLLMTLGLILYSLNYTTENYFNLWMQITVFGGLLFLLIFEAGRSRYLYQFMPAIISISASGYSQFYMFLKRLFISK